MNMKQLEARADALETMIAQADNKDLPALNKTFQAIFDRLVALDLAGVTDEEDLPCQSNRS